MYNAQKFFYSVPVDTAREVSSRVVHAVMSERPAPKDLVDARGQQLLRDALQAEFPMKSRSQIVSFVAETVGTAHALATFEWRMGPHRSGDTARVDAESLRAALIVHLSGTPGSLPARLRAEAWAAHKEVNRPARRKNPGVIAEGLTELHELHIRQQAALHGYWDELSTKLRD